MIGLSYQFTDTTKRVVDSADKATFRNLPHAAASIRKTAIESIVDAPGPSAPGSPPHTHTARVTRSGKRRKGQLQRAIVFDLSKSEQSAFIGPRFSVVGLAGEAHELGTEFRGQDFDERPYMGPALEDNLGRFASDWSGSIGQ